MIKVTPSRLQILEHKSCVIRQALEIVEQVDEEEFLGELARISRDDAKLKALTAEREITGPLVVVNDKSIVELCQTKTKLGKVVV